MAEWPQVPPMKAVQIPSLNLPVLRAQYDQGYMATRARFTRSRRRYLVQYTGLRTDEYHALQAFVEGALLGGALTFDWTYPNGTAITDATNATPIVVTTQYAHGLLEGMRVLVADVEGNTAANGTWTISNVTATTMTLDGSAGNGAYTQNGTVAIRFENSMGLAIPGDTYSDANELLGPIVDSQGWLSPSYVFEERF